MQSLETLHTGRIEGDAKLGADVPGQLWMRATTEHSDLVHGHILGTPDGDAGALARALEPGKRRPVHKGT